MRAASPGQPRACSTSATWAAATHGACAISNQPKRSVTTPRAESQRSLARSRCPVRPDERLSRRARPRGASQRTSRPDEHAGRLGAQGPSGPSRQPVRGLDLAESTGARVGTGLRPPRRRARPPAALAPRKLLPQAAAAAMRLPVESRRWHARVTASTTSSGRLATSTRSSTVSSSRVRAGRATGCRRWSTWLLRCSLMPGCRCTHQLDGMVMSTTVGTSSYKPSSHAAVA